MGSQEVAELSLCFPNAYTSCQLPALFSVDCLKEWDMTHFLLNTDKRTSISCLSHCNKQPRSVDVCGWKGVDGGGIDL